MQIAKKITVKKGGAVIRTMSGGGFTLGGVERTPVVHDDGSVGYTEEYKETVLEADTNLAAGEKLGDLNFKDVTVSVELDTGQRFVMRNAFSQERPKTQDGKIPLKISCETCEEI
ncbi:MAG: phage tail tube protein [Rhodospirillaceae bacterium]|nr:phage tail tube protein [Rhodospirillaceae bacterium]